MQAALFSLLVLILAFPAAAHAQPIESEVLPPVAMTPQPMPAYTPPVPSQPSSAPTRYEAPTQTLLDPTGDSGMSGTSGGTSVYDMGAPATSYTQPSDNMPPVPPASNSANETPTGTTPIRNWHPNQDISTRGDDANLANKKFCNLKISFTSQCCGTDAKTGEKIKMYLTANPDILTYSEHRWGKEGEYDYCVDIPEHKNRAKIYTDLKRLLPPASAKVPATNILGDGFEPVSTYR